MDCGFDAGKKVTCRERHTLVDTLGLILKVVVTPGNVQDRNGTKRLLKELANQHDVIRGLKRIWADGNHRGALVVWVAQLFGWTLEVMEKPKEQDGFQTLPQRWLIERTFARLVRQSA